MIMTIQCYLESLGEQLEVVDEGLHRGFHLSSAGGNTLGVISPHVTCNDHLMIIIITNDITIISHQLASD